MMKLCFKIYKYRFAISLKTFSKKYHRLKDSAFKIYKTSMIELFAKMING